MQFNRILIFFVMLPVILMSACAAPSATTAPTTAPVLATATPSSTATQAPTETARPSLTPIATATPDATETIPPTATLPPTPDPALSNVKMIGLAWYKNYDLLLSFQFSGPVNPKKYRVTLEDKEYSCEVLAQFPNRLYCRGQGAKVLAVAKVRIYPAGYDQPGFEKDVWVPYFP
jgi:hypothetical protein